MTRLILDISTIARWTGPPVGIVRVEFELAQHAMRRGHGVQLTFYDPVTASLRALEPAWQKLVLGLDGVIDTIGIDFRRPRPRWRNMLSLRYPAVMWLERHRLMGSAATSAMANRLQNLLLGSDSRKTRIRRPVGPARCRRALPPRPGTTDTAGRWRHSALRRVGLAP